MMLRLAFCALLAAPTMATDLAFTSFVTAVPIDAGGGHLAGTEVGDILESAFVCPSTAGQAYDVWCEPNECDWSFEGLFFVWNDSRDTGSFGGANVSVNIQNDWPLDDSSAAYLSSLLGTPIAEGTIIDSWTIGSHTDFAWYESSPTPQDPDNEILFDGAAYELAFVDLDATIYSGLDYSSTPPDVAGVELVLLTVEQADASGQPLFLAMGVARPGDADGDGDVDLDDFVVLKKNFGTPSGATIAQGDFDYDEDVDLDDFVILKKNFGTALP